MPQKRIVLLVTLALVALSAPSHDYPLTILP